MKKGIIAFMLMVGLVAAMLIGCSSDDSESSQGDGSENEVEESTNDGTDETSVEENHSEENDQESEINGDIESEESKEDEVLDEEVIEEEDDVIEDTGTEEDTSSEDTDSSKTEDGNDQANGEDDAGNEGVDSTEKEAAVLEVVDSYYTHLQEDEFAESISFMYPDYLTYIGITERDYINMYMDHKTLYDWSIEEYSIRSIDKVSLEVQVPEAVEPLITTSETYIVIVDIRTKMDNETSGVVDDVIISLTDDGEWQIFGIVSY
ncbi:MULTISPECIES: hypothetical protein [Bacillaceae]|uniref:Uncharacterized protein n=1 Tax=Evansella alkalicola TaxID=745819 RepID=A0ABS6JZ69_9BACI|nr:MULTISPECIES: hypothetical protein [Bacillaceae]MBU9723878.1 hypothetical protein [Bacillus alkalicola]